MAGGTAVLAQRVLEAVFGDQAIRRLAQTAKDDLDGRVQALLSAELLRYHQCWTACRSTPSRPSGCGGPRPRCSRRAPMACPSSEVESPALPAAEERRAIEAPTVTQIPVLQPARPPTTSSTPNWSTRRGRSSADGRSRDRPAAA